MTRHRKGQRPAPPSDAHPAAGLTARSSFRYPFTTMIERTLFPVMIGSGWWWWPSGEECVSAGSS